MMSCVNKRDLIKKKKKKKNDIASHDVSTQNLKLFHHSKTVWKKKMESRLDFSLFCVHVYLSFILLDPDDFIVDDEGQPIARKKKKGHKPRYTDS